LNKAIWLLISLLVIVPQLETSASQNSGPSEHEESIYTRALSASLEKMTRQWGDRDDSLSGAQIRTDWKNIIVEKFPEITDGMPSRLGDVGIQYFDVRELIERSRKMRKPFSVLIAHPMKTEGSRLKVSYTFAWFEYRKGMAQFAVDSWSNVFFSYDQGSQRYIVDEVKLGGV
jgi:hypothetical protein